ncbi:MAG: DUF3050 domain-containing protein [Planctomycetota bacterium]|nr:MAG: DUF3050 domain-containing protein [Planctomycetota bacterium]
MTSTERIQARLAPTRQSLLEHAIYARIDSLPALRTFMEHHVFAVWDFMSLLKTLQQRLTTVHAPWLPPENREACRLVNEIVLAEESDEDGQGGYASHFELYLRAMQQCGADTSAVERFVERLHAGSSVPQALDSAKAPGAVVDFVTQTFAVIDSGDLCAIAATFTFGREELLPDLFRQMVRQLSVQADGSLDRFTYYLHRHIDLDDEQHGPMAERLVALLCGIDEANWRRAENAAAGALRSRERLWGGVETALADSLHSA